MATKHNINFKKIFGVELLYHGFTYFMYHVAHLWWLWFRLHKGENYFENIYFCQEM